ncbi:RNA polymerase, sigma-24 subunit, ECF subfamily [Methylocella silvestris BL2]|uniref:RNA polymerase, sigma-24 subunit, ECF subfamily n=1 Tax=Methylocella silvestris (strain DSM 15510 / CIP 108128 / LMG 27833 / NCIMB 13906 / BL2) TaxID=395965 RepID=B8EP46_METSB|nr:sigma-70 family RNA polymerase sigma factor [Methylocella silvestris]ACK49284.1 RNA polymerase, sigma-24 subunit, ECF subfamily [Methylocella silvestris BL2]
MRVEDREKQWRLLMLSANGGDAAAYRNLLVQLTPALRAFARRGVARAGAALTDAEDIVQETLLAVHLKRQTWDEQAPLSPWLFAIARHKLIDALRRRGRRIELSIDDFAESLPSADAGSDSIVSDVKRHLEELPPGQRKVVNCIAVEGVSIDEAASRLSMSNGAVRVALHRGLAALAAKFRSVES